MSARVLTNKERKLLENMGFNTTKISNTKKWANDRAKKAEKRAKSNYVK